MEFSAGASGYAFDTGGIHETETADQGGYAFWRLDWDGSPAEGCGMDRGLPVCRYGRSYRGKYRVVDEYGRDCPYWAEGELWIGGFGVAKGYRGDSALTGQKFITDQYGRWYRTGDLGRIWDDETIEFLGRKDHQVKIRGHRIELGEIEHAIQEFPGVAHAVVDTVSDGHGNKTLAAYIGAPLQEDSKVTTYLYGTDIFGGGWKELKDDVSNWQMQQERKTAYKNFLAYADQRCVQLMLETLIELGVFVSEKEVLSQKEIFEKGSITETQKNTVARWLEILKKEAYREGSGCTGKSWRYGNVF